MNYRKNVGIIIINKKNELLVGKRNNSNYLQFPQGGVEDGETSKEALFREVKEELNLTKYTVLKKSTKKYRYKVPEKYRPKSWNNLYIGQEQTWFLAQTEDEEWIYDKTKVQTIEFESIYWIKDINKILEGTVYFKKLLYKEIIKDLI